MSRQYYKDQFDEKMRDEVIEIRTSMQNLILVINRAEIEVSNAMKELNNFIEKIDSK